MTDLNAKITEIEGKIPSITELTTNSELNAVENKIPDVRGLLTKRDYSGHGEEEFLFGNRTGRNLIILGTDMSSSVHASNKAKNILVFGKYFVQELDNRTIYAEKLYSINFNKTNKKILLKLAL